MKFYIIATVILLGSYMAQNTLKKMLCKFMGCHHLQGVAIK
ncbi:hypothetical protein [Helicobacter cinaedi]|uniref:Uncharacterized protein n=1 Tax=Helicobacter cinaedi CCUG 18818 = ATCC BAA-847 TaxID=537971 RepID=A0ABN0BCW2_9HELI|nr:hypothetical protein [Helicobacter cinaedi]EFR47365.1 hypothetical protein HCCG_01913 [Helicobacter cinaedi CCUG 18818 = ATCC BAA-847]